MTHPSDQPDSTKCPACGGAWSSPVRRADQLIALMRAHRGDAYAAQNGGYFVSCGGGRIDKAAIDEALALALIVEKFPGRGHEYWSLRDAK